jgi:hypothetical protein
VLSEPPLSPQSRAWQTATLLAWTALAAVVGWRFSGQATDDIYITYRYVQNLAGGNGFVFNPGERVFGVTDPGTGLVLAALHLLTRLPIPAAGTLLTALCLLATAVLLLREGAERGRLPEATAGGTLLLSSAYLWIGQGSGPLVALPLLLAAARCGEKRQGRSDLLGGALAGLAFWCRPDAAPAAGWLALLRWRERRRFPWAYVLAVAAVALTGVLAAWAWFGTPIPNTLVAKRQFAALNPARFTGARVFWGTAWELFRYHGGALSAVLASLGIAGQWVLFRRSGAAGRLLVLHSATLALAYTLVRVPFFLWYTIPTVVAVLYGACFLAGAAVRRAVAAARGAGLAGWNARFSAGVFALLLLGFAASWGGSTLRWWRDGNRGDWRLAAYSVAGDWIRANTPPGSTIAFEEIGILAFHSERPILDMVGLVSPSVLRYTATGDFLGAFLERPTDLVVFHTFHRRGGSGPIVARPWFDDAYERAARFRFPELGGAIEVYRRRPGAWIPPPRPPVARRPGSPGL